MIHTSRRQRYKNRKLRHSVLRRITLRGLAQYAFLAVLFVVLPFYPWMVSFGFMQDAGGGGADYDPASIISAISGRDFDALFSGADEFLNPDTGISESRDVRGFGVTKHIVQYGETLSEIADQYSITMSSIRWANNIARGYENQIRAGTELQIPPVTGLMYTVKAGDTVESIAKKYKIDSKSIIAQNDLQGASLGQGNIIILPDAEPIAPPKPKYVAPKKTYVTRTSTKTTTSGPTYSFSKQAASQYVADTGYAYQLQKQSEGRNFVWGNCTYFVAKYKNVTWRGNAKDWYANAQAKGVATGRTPALGSIVVLHGRGYNPRYGHVAIVVDIIDGHIIVKDMNYRRLNEVTTRKIPLSDGSIMGYIYAS